MLVTSLVLLYKFAVLHTNVNSKMDQTMKLNARLAYLEGVIAGRAEHKQEIKSAAIESGKQTTEP